MLKSDRKLKELADILKNDDTIVITESIETLRQETPFEGAITLLTAYYNNTDDISIRKSIAGFMNDLKDQGACGEIIAETGKNWKDDTISMLVASCWQSGLDYSAYTLDLAKVFLRGNYVTAIECLTVIEESVHDLDNVQKAEVIKLIKDNPFPPGNEKSTLTLELLTILNK
jgi:hypothetical protein